MQVSDEGIEEFRRIWKEEYGEEITVEFARMRASQLMELYWLLAQIEKRTSLEGSEEP